MHLSKKINEDHAIRLILEGTAADVGEKFFRSLVANLSEVLNTSGAWVTEYNEQKRRLNTLAFILDGHWINNFSYDITGSACETVINDNRLVHIPERLLDLYHGNPDLAEIEVLLKDKKAVSYLGVPLTNANAKILGHLSVVDSQPIPNHPQVVNIFRIFANRASAELQRLQAETKVQHKEEKFRKLFDSTMDAIIETDKQLRITRINPSGERLIKSSSNHVLGKNISQFLTTYDYKKLKKLIQSITKLPQDQQKLYIPGGLKIKSLDNDEFPTEGTLSRFELGVEGFFTIIVRNEKEKLEAEQKIQSMSLEAEYLKEEIRTLGNYNEIIGDSQALVRVLNRVHQVAKTDATVLIYGETGTGKEAIARAIHNSSNRSEKPMITVNCAAIPRTLIESEFFGHEKGSFTGATAKRQGRFALADRGTIFLDEIGELSIDMQSKLLRVLQEGDFEPLGSSSSVSVDVRVIAATNRKLEREIGRGNFREDLYYRLNVFPISVPPLRERGDDVVKLASYFTQKFCRRMGSPIKILNQQDIESLRAYHWPGNVRELQNVIERAVIISRGDQIDLKGVIPVAFKKGPSDKVVRSDSTLKRILSEEEIRQMEKDNLMFALETTGWRVSGEKGAARLLGMNPSTFASRMKKYGIKRP